MLEYIEPLEAYNIMNHVSIKDEYFYLASISKWIYRNLKQFYKQLLISSTSVAGRKDYYTAMLLCDVLCFLTIVFGYAYFSVSIVHVCMHGCLMNALKIIT